MTTVKNKIKKGCDKFNKIIFTMYEKFIQDQVLPTIFTAFQFFDSPDHFRI